MIWPFKKKAQIEREALERVRFVIRHNNLDCIDISLAAMQDLVNSSGETVQGWKIGKTKIEIDFGGQ